MRSVRVSSLGPGWSEVTAVSPSKAPLLWAGLRPPVRDVCFHGSHLCPQNRERLRAGSRPNSLRPYCPKLLTGSHLAAPHPPGACGAGRRPRTCEVCGRWGGCTAGPPPHVCAVPRRHRCGRKAGRPIARPPEGALSAPPHGGLSQVSWTRRAKATASTGPPDSRSGVCCKGAGEMLGPVEALPSLSPGHPPSGAALAGPRHAEARGLP